MINLAVCHAVTAQRRSLSRFSSLYICLTCKYLAIHISVLNGLVCVIVFAGV